MYSLRRTIAGFVIYIEVILYASRPIALPWQRSSAARPHRVFRRTAPGRVDHDGEGRKRKGTELLSLTMEGCCGFFAANDADRRWSQHPGHAPLCLMETRSVGIKQHASARIYTTSEQGRLGCALCRQYYLPSMKTVRSIERGLWRREYFNHIHG